MQITCTQLYVYILTYIYVYIYVYILTYIYVYIYVYILTYIYVYIYNGLQVTRTNHY